MKVDLYDITSEFNDYFADIEPRLANVLADN